jgi:hypothetical protein
MRARYRAQRGVRASPYPHAVPERELAPSEREHHQNNYDDDNNSPEADIHGKSLR